ncbi:MAG: hypothetical protein R6U10_02585 [Thermoplasmatota archaeon]
MKKTLAAVAPGLFALVIGCVILAYGIASGAVGGMSFSDPYILLGGLFVAIGLTVLLIAPAAGR